MRYSIYSYAIHPTPSLCPLPLYLPHFPTSLPHSLSHCRPHSLPLSSSLPPSLSITSSLSLVPYSDSLESIAGRQSEPSRITFDREIYLDSLTLPAARTLAFNLFPEDPECLMKASRRLPGQMSILAKYCDLELIRSLANSAGSIIFLELLLLLRLSLLLL